MPHKIIKVFCEWDLGCGHTSIWDDKENAEEYFKQLFEDNQEVINMTFEEALKQKYILFKDATDKELK